MVVEDNKVEIVEETKVSQHVVGRGNRNDGSLIETFFLFHQCFGRNAGRREGKQTAEQYSQSVHLGLTIEYFAKNQSLQANATTSP